MSDKPIAEFPVEPEDQPTLEAVSRPLDLVTFVPRQPGDCQRCGGQR